MNARLCLIDTDIYSYILKRKESPYKKAREYLSRHGRFKISCITYYECLRGYRAVNAHKRLQIFQKFLNITDILYIDQQVLETASEIYGLLKKRGELPGEFDILIGATAISHNLALITNNQRHYRPFGRHFSLETANWERLE